MGKGVLSGLVNAQVAGASVGQALGPAAVIGQSISAIESAVGGLLSGIKGLIGSVVTLLPGESGDGGSGGDGGASGTGSGGDGSGTYGGGSGNPLVGPQLSGAGAGQGIGPGTDLGASLPSGNWFPYGNSGSKGPLGSSVHPLPDVGGVLFENCAATLTEIEELSGAYWDAQTSSLVLVGRPRTGIHPAPIKLPSMDRDNLAVALRAYIAGLPIGVSIDPPSEYRDGMKQGVTPPDGTQMFVSYLGNTEGTIFGAIMFEADRLLKCLDKGTDNISRKPLRAKVHGYVPLLEKISPGGNRQTNVWHRFWFVIDKVELKHDKQTGSIAFGDIRLKVLTETEMEGVEGGNRIDPLDAEFTQHISEHYDEYARDFPVLARLKDLAKIAAVAKFLCEQKIPLDLGELFLAPLKQVRTPTNTPGISVTSPHVKVERFGNVTQTHTVSLFGGVDLDPKIMMRTDDGLAKKMRNASERYRPSPSVAQWQFIDAQNEMLALSARVGKTPVSYRISKSSDDHLFHTQGVNGFMRIHRIYDSTSPRKSDFGPGWFLWVPFSISILSHCGKRAEVLTAKEKANYSEPDAILILHDYTQNESFMLRHVENEGSNKRMVYCKVVDQRFHDGRVSFQYDPSFVVYCEKNRFLFEDKEFTYMFDTTGNLREIYKSGQKEIYFDWNEGRISQIHGLKECSYRFIYESMEGVFRIASISASDGHILYYEYDSHGCLKSWRDGAKKQAIYGYDVRSRLTECRDAEGRLTMRNIYDDFGRRLSNSDVIISGSGSKIQRCIRDGRLTGILDDKGTCTTFKYDDHACLGQVKTMTAKGRSWEMWFDSIGRLEKFTNHIGLTWVLLYNPNGKVEHVVAPNGKKQSFEWKGEHLSIVRNWKGQMQSATYDHDSKIKRIHVKGNDELLFDFNGASGCQAQGSFGHANLRFNQGHMKVEARGSGGAYWKYKHDICNRKLSVKRSGNAKSMVSYNDDGDIKSIETKAARISYTVDERLLTVDVQIQSRGRIAWFARRRT